MKYIKINDEYILADKILKISERKHKIIITDISGKEYIMPNESGYSNSDYISYVMSELGYIKMQEKKMQTTKTFW